MQVENLGKKYNKRWVFRHLTEDFSQTGQYAILGANGSGKSTLLKVLSAQTEADEGSVLQQTVTPSISYTSPYSQIPEEFTFTELLKFHLKFKTLKKGWSIDKILQITQLDGVASRQIKAYSSGMKQRVKLSLSFYFENQIVFLDEPCSHLDEMGVAWYQEQLKSLDQELVFIASNQSFEYPYSEKRILLSNFKD